MCEQTEHLCLEQGLWGGVTEERGTGPLSAEPLSNWLQGREDHRRLGRSTSPPPQPGQTQKAPQERAGQICHLAGACLLAWVQPGEGLKLEYTCLGRDERGQGWDRPRMGKRS